MCGNNCRLKRKELLQILLSIYVLLNTNVVEGGSTLAPSTSADHPLDLDSPAVCENARIAVGAVSESDKKSNWVSRVLSEKLSNFRPKSRANQLCNQQSDLYEKSLRNLTLWAVQMMEASAGSSSGILVGQRYHLGHYDECIAIRNPSVSGRYCAVNIKFWPTPELHGDFYTGASDGQNTSPYSTAWDVLKKPKNPMLEGKNDIYWGICVPAACTRLDIEESLNKTFADVLEKHGVLLEFGVDDHLCSSSVEDESIPAATKITIYVIASLSVICVLATVYHLSTWNIPNWEKRGGLAHKIIMSFSISTNFDILTRRAGKLNMNVLDALKVLSFGGEPISHRIISIFVSMVFNPSSFESELKMDHRSLVPTLGTEIYIVTSGFLTYVTHYSGLKKHGIKIIPLMIFKRWARLMPSFLTFLAVYIFVLPYMDNGPGWKYVTIITNRCREYWWLNVLGLHNIFVPESSADLYADHTWYLSCDLQLFPVGLILVYMFSRSPSIGLKFALSTLAVTSMITFSAIYFNNIYAVFKLDRSLSIEPIADHFYYIYSQSYARAGSYILGIISAFVLFRIKENNWILSCPLRWLVLLAVTGVGLGTQYYGFAFYDEGKEYNPLEHAIFGALHRSIWGFMFCVFIVIQIAWGFGGNLDKLWNHQIYVPLSRLTYLVFLFHPIWQILTVASLRAPIYLSVWQIIWMIAGDFLVVFGAALWLFLIIEAPANTLITLLMDRFIRIGQSERQGSRKVD